MMTSAALWKLPAALANSNSAAAAGKAMAELGVAACIGAGCVQQELLNRPVVSALSKTTFGILLPMFLGTSIMRTVARYGLSKSSLAGPLLGVLQPFLLYQLAKLVLVPLCGIDKDSDDGRCTAVCSAWGNSSVVPLIFCESLFRNSPEYLAKSYANVSLFLVGWSPFFWSYGRAALVGKDESNTNSSNDATLLQKLKPLFPPPVIGTSIGLLLALWTPVRDLFMGGPLQTIYNSFATFGGAASPLSLLVLISSLALNIGIRPKSQPKEEVIVIPTKVESDIENSNRASFVKQFICVSLSRFILSPLLMVGLLKGFQKIGLVSGPQQAPMLWFIAILQGSMPSAQNSVLMLQVSNKPEQAGVMAKFLFFIYAASMIPLVAIISVALQRFGLA
ncbi:unnamed protein product [Cylindrotheca closterium]|uniref:Uncharacterized protein n=1 Tax=Cylindrotheca closterium TaxID=2856 RepID=A0AAD2FHS8_9STRA|nr:unnamed protein product [Cylindrotheca closterium]